MKNLYGLIKRALQAYRINSFVQFAGDSENLRVRFLCGGRKNKCRIIQASPIMVRVYSLLKKYIYQLITLLHLSSLQ